MKKLIIFAIIICLSAVVGCKKEAHKDEAPKTADSLELLRAAMAGVKLPVGLADGCKADTISFAAADSTLSIALQLTEDYADSAGLAGNRGSQMFAFSLLLTNDTLGHLLETARCVPVNVRVNFSSPAVGALGEITIGKTEFHAMMLEAPDERRRDEVKVHNRVSYDNQFCPYDLEEGVRMLSMNVQDRYVTFRTLIDDELLDFHVMKENRDSVNAAVIESLRMQLDDSLQRQSLKEIAFARLGYRNRYICSGMTDSFDITFTPADIERLIATSDSIRAAKEQEGKKDADKKKTSKK